MINDLKLFKTENTLNKKNIVLYGAGLLGIEVYEMLKYAGIAVAYFCDSNPKKHGKRIDGIEIIPPGKLKELDSETIIIITIYNENIAKQCLDFIKTLNKKLKKVFTALKFFNNLCDYWIEITSQENEILKKIRNKFSFNNVELINKGFSLDKKYCVTDKNGMNYFLRISNFTNFKRQKKIFSLMKQPATLGIPMSIPLDFGVCDLGVYILTSWIDGEIMAAISPSLSNAELYNYGLKCGEILRKIHSIPAPQTIVKYEEINKIDISIKTYKKCGKTFDGDNIIITYIEQNLEQYRFLFENRPQCFIHGDYHLGNIILENGNLKIVDFDACGFGDSWYDFYCLFLGAIKNNDLFRTALIKGYFNGEPPNIFWRLSYFYTCIYSLEFFCYHLINKEYLEKVGIRNIQGFLKSTNNLKKNIPSWYK